MISEKVIFMFKDRCFILTSGILPYESKYKEIYYAYFPPAGTH